MKSPPVYHEGVAHRCEVRDWFTQPLGERLLCEERRYLDEVLPYLFGYHLVQVGRFSACDLLYPSRVLHRVVIDPDYGTNPLVPDIYGCPDSLPVESGSVDVLLLHHTLEFEPEPHQVLREADRVLIPEGHAVILNFNPWSIWGMWRLAARRGGRAPWCGQFISLTRLKDWLALLGFDVVTCRPYFFLPPLHSEAIMQKLQFLDRLSERWWPLLPGAYLIVAKKRVATLTPIRPRWRPRRSRLLAPDLARPAHNHTIHERR